MSLCGRLALQLTKSILKKEKAKRTKRAVIERRRREVNQPGPRFPEEHFPAPLEVPPGPNDSHHRAQVMHTQYTPAYVESLPCTGISYSTAHPRSVGPFVPL